ncbi:MAG: N-acetylmuramoyl-L-alanine amidase [Oscillospiraceae bacterium]|nr:N-acetylmuramoyl-L-alanine amidase [Oscillospiraceae bacterium]
MKKFGALREKIPFLGLLSCCVVVLAISGAVRSAEKSESTMATASDKQVILLDAGHGGIDSGGVGINGAYEKDINLSIVKNLGALLTLSGYEVVYTRTEDISIYDNGVEGIRNQKISDMENRLEIIERYPESIFLSVHQNQYTDKAYFGGQMFYTTNNSGNFRLATIMQNKFAELQTGNDRNVKLIDNNLYLFKNTKQPALLIECGFLSNENDAANLSTPEYQKKVAFTIYRGLTEYLTEVQNKESTESYGETESFLYMQ